MLALLPLLPFPPVSHHPPRVWVWAGVGTPVCMCVWVRRRLGGARETFGPEDLLVLPASVSPRASRRWMLPRNRASTVLPNASAGVCIVSICSCSKDKTSATIRATLSIRTREEQLGGVAGKAQAEPSGVRDGWRRAEQSQPEG